MCVSPWHQWLYLLSVISTVCTVPVREAANGGEARGDLQLPGGQEGASGGGRGASCSGWGGGGRG